MGTTIKIFETAEDSAQYFASLLSLRIRQTPCDQRFSWVLSGGTTPATIYSEIAKGPCIIPWSRVRIFWGDERCAGPGDDESNYKMAFENLLDHLSIHESNIFRIRGEEPPLAEAERYAGLFARYVHNEGGVPRPDLVMLGLGQDGHTASVFPANIDLFASDKLFVPSDHPDTKQKRITATGKVINNARTVVMIANGESKASVAARVLNHLPGWDKLPAARVHPEGGELIWLLDRKAAGRLR